MKFKKKIFLSYLILISIFIIVNSIIMGGLFSFFEKNSFKENNIVFSRNTADRIGISMKQYIDTFPLKFHSKILDLLTLDKFLKNIEIYSTNGNLIYSYSDFFKKEKTPYINFSRVHLKNITTASLIKKGYFIVFVPLREETDEHNYTIVYYYRYILFFDYFLKSFLLLLLINLPLFTVFAVILNKYSSRITGSVEKLSEFAEKMRRKEFHRKVDIGSTDEFKNLSLTMSEMAEEISRSMQRERELRELLESVIENSPTGIIIIDKNQKIVFKNSKFINNYEKNTKLLWFIFDSLEKIDLPTEKKIDNSYFLLLSYSIPELKKVVLIDDITDEINMREKIIFAQKMESLGIFVSSFVHDLKNMIGVISGYLDIIKDFAKENTLQEYVNSMENGIKNTENLISNFLKFSKGSEEDLEPFLVTDIIDETLSLIGRKLTGIKIIKEIMLPENTTIKCNKEDIIQMLINIILNAVDAVTEKKEKTIQIAVLKKSFVKHHVLHKGEYIKISIKDNGIGIKKDDKEKIFEPFFSTKERKGTGLGLFSCYLIAKKHKGIIEVESEENQGTEFHIYLKADE